MTTPAERTATLHQTRELLKLITVTFKEDVPAPIRDLATTIERHYPSAADIENIVSASNRGAVSNPLLEPTNLKLQHGPQVITN